MKSELSRRLRTIRSRIDTAVSALAQATTLSAFDSRSQDGSRATHGLRYGYGDTLSLSAYLARYQPIAAATDYCLIRVPFWSPGPSAVLSLGGIARFANKTGASQAFTLKYSVNGAAKTTFTNTPTAAIAASSNGSTVQISIDRVGGASGVPAGWNTLELYVAVNTARSTAGEYVGFSILTFTIFENPDMVDTEGARYN